MCPRTPFPLTPNAAVTIYDNGKHLEKLPLKRTKVNYNLVQPMLGKGFKVTYIAKDNTKLELDFPQDFKMMAEFMNNCSAPMMQAAERKYLEKNKDLTCWNNPSACEDGKKPAGKK
jgi:hypothetical protein